DELADRVEQQVDLRVGAIQGPPDMRRQVRVQQPLGVARRDALAVCDVEMARRLLANARQRLHRDAHRLHAPAYRRPGGRRDRGAGDARGRAVPLVDGVAEDLDPIAGAEQRSDGPGLVAEDTAVELEALPAVTVQQL